jgi:hypothetical protein
VILAQRFNRHLSLDRVFECDALPYALHSSANGVASLGFLMWYRSAITRGGGAALFDRLEAWRRLCTL